MDLGAVAFRGTTRFRLVRFLGRGGMGVVYEAFDEANRVPVALKLLPVVNPDMLLRFKREFRAVADVRHPNLVRLGELVSEGSQWFFTMELVEGIDLISHVRGLEPPARPLETPALASDAPTPIVAPGEALRRYDPGGSNVYKEDRLRRGPDAAGARAGRAARRPAASTATSNRRTCWSRPRGARCCWTSVWSARRRWRPPIRARGRPSTCRPSRSRLQPVSAAADWYAFGVILFEILSGRLPFEGLPHEILYRKQHGRPPRLAALAPGAPADLAALCDRLLEPDPDARPTGAEVLAVLEPARAGGHRPRRRRAATSRPPSSGASAELKVLAAALNEVRSGQGARLLVVRGESGVGKSSLVATFLQRLEDDANPEASDTAWVERGPPLVLTARCYERELVPFKAFDGLVDALTHVLRRLDAETLSRVIPDRAAVLLQAFPVLGRVPLIAHAPQQHVGTDPREVRDSMFVAFRQLLRGLAALAPIVAFVDDLQWADADSRALLTEVLRPPDAPRMLLIGTFRTTSAEERAATLLGGEVPEQQLALGNLDSDAARELARELLASSGSSANLDRDAEVMARESGGHPLFLLELARTAHLRRGKGASADAGRRAARAAGVVFGAGGAAAARAGHRRRADAGADAAAPGRRRRPGGPVAAGRAARRQAGLRGHRARRRAAGLHARPDPTGRAAVHLHRRGAHAARRAGRSLRGRGQRAARGRPLARGGAPGPARPSTSRRRRGGRPRRWPSIAPPSSTATRWRWGTGPRNSAASCWSAWATRWPTRDTAPRRPRTT